MCEDRVGRHQPWRVCNSFSHTLRQPVCAVVISPRGFGTTAARTAPGRHRGVINPEGFATTIARAVLPPRPRRYQPARVRDRALSAGSSRIVTVLIWKLVFELWVEDHCGRDQPKRVCNIRSTGDRSLLAWLDQPCRVRHRPSLDRSAAVPRLYQPKKVRNGQPRSIRMGVRIVISPGGFGTARRWS